MRTVKPRFTDTSSVITDSLLCPRKKKPLTFLDIQSPLILTLSVPHPPPPPSVSVFTGFDDNNNNNNNNSNNNNNDNNDITMNWALAKYHLL